MECTFIIKSAATNPSNEATKACIETPSGTGLLGQTSVQLRKSSIASSSCMEDPQYLSSLAIQSNVLNGTRKIPGRLHQRATAKEVESTSRNDSSDFGQAIIYSTPQNAERQIC